MPTVLLLDVSLSMSRPVPASDTTESPTRHTIATAAINTFLDYLSVHAKLEYVALVTFSSTYEVVVPFTRDFDSIKTKLPLLEDGDKTCIEIALQGVNQLILSEWGYQTPVQIILVTDGSCGVGPIGRNRIIQSLPLPPSFPAKIHILPIVSPHDPCLQQAMPLYQKIVDLATNPNNSTNGAITRGTIYCPDQLSLPGVVTAITRLCEQQYQEFWCSLKCGQLEARVQLFPAPHAVPDDGLSGACSLAGQMHVIGFIHQQELGTPIAISKHVIIPQAQPNSSNSANRENYGSKTPTKEGSNESTSNEEESDPSKVPNFCVLLHGALKVEGMSAVVALGTEWWGTVSAWCEAARARRSCLLLSVLRPGAHAAPWLGTLDQLGPADDNNAGGESFPVRSWRSYSGGGSGCAWARPHALLADVQKVLRHARKLPDKTQHLYKELNRLRRAAISLGFSELLTSVSSALERECAALGAGAPPECALQLAHAAATLRDPRTMLDVKHALAPLSGSHAH